jgi:hypothetical protein
MMPQNSSRNIAYSRTNHKVCSKVISKFIDFEILGNKIERKTQTNVDDEKCFL